jgi:hypothetical protein
MNLCLDVLQVSPEQVEEFCKRMGDIPHFEVSAKEDTNVELVGRFIADITVPVRKVEDNKQTISLAEDPKYYSSNCCI